jgi:cell division protein FtsA
MNISNTEGPIIVGLDIGTTKVAAIAGRRNVNGKVEILGFGRADSSGVEHGMVLNLEQCIKSIRIALDECMASNPSLDIQEVYVGIAGQHIKSLQNRGERVRSKPDELIANFDIEALIKDQRQAPIPAGDRIVDIVPQDYTVDGFSGIIDPRGRTGVKIGANFHIITGDAGAIKNIKRSVEESGVRLKDLELQPLASAAAVMSAEEFEAGVAIVDIGGGTTDLAVFADGMLKHTKVIPFAGVNVTNDIRRGLQVLKSQAEQLKIKFGCAIAQHAPVNEFITIPGIRGAKGREISRAMLAQIIEARMQEILNFVLLELRSQNLENKLGAGIILTGGGSSLAHLRQLAEFKTGLNARLGTPTEHLAAGYNKAVDNPVYATCIGLILRGISDYEKGRLGNDFADDVATPKIITEEKTIQTKIPTDVPTDLPTKEADVEVTAPTAFTSKLKMPSLELNLDMASLKNAVDKRAGNVKRVFGTISNQFMSWFEEVDDQTLNDDKKFDNEPE